VAGLGGAGPPHSCRTWTRHSPDGRVCGRRPLWRRLGMSQPGWEGPACAHRRRRTASSWRLSPAGHVVPFSAFASMFRVLQTCPSPTQDCMWAEGIWHSVHTRCLVTMLSKCLIPNQSSLLERGEGGMRRSNFHRPKEPHSFLQILIAYKVPGCRHSSCPTGACILINATKYALNDQCAWCVMDTKIIIQSKGVESEWECLILR
jgi:hypothetical protein